MAASLSRTIVKTPCIVVPLYNLSMAGGPGGDLGYIPTAPEEADDWAVYKWSMRREAFVFHCRAGSLTEAKRKADEVGKVLLAKWGE